MMADTQTQVAVAAGAPLVCIDELKLKRVIGRGRTSMVYRAHLHTDETRSYAVKVFADDDEPDTEKCVKREADIQRLVHDHPNIAKVFDHDDAALVLEYMPNCDFYEFLRRAQKPLPARLTRYLFRCIVRAVRHLHERHVCHRDLKLENILLDEQFVPKLCDFGLALQLENASQKVQPTIGTQGYQSPQQVRSEAHNAFKSDVFALGAILFRIVQGVPPFHRHAAHFDPYYKYFALRQEDEYWQLLRQKYPHFYFDDGFIDLVSGMLRDNESERLTIFQVEEHAWLNGDVMDDAERIEYMNEYFVSKQKSVSDDDDC